MKYLSVAETAKKWGISERSVRNYCEQNRVPGAFLTGKTWNIPENALKPIRKEGKLFSDNLLLNILKEQKDVKLKGGIYHKIQIEFSYNSNHIEGSKLSVDQTRMIFETQTLSADKNVNVDDIIETSNHFKCVDYIIENAKKPLTQNLIKELHFILKSGTSDSRLDWFKVGDYKLLPNEVAGMITSEPKNVKNEMQNLIDKYNKIERKTLEDIVAFHKEFESIHPFQDGNGRVGRLIMFKECLNNNITPFIIDEEHKIFYYRGLKEWENERGFLIETCASCQDKFKSYLNYFKIDY